MNNELLSKHTTFKIGGPAEILLIPENEEELILEIIHLKKNGINYKILGNGSNLLISDKGIKGVIIKNTEANSLIKKNGETIEIGSSIFLQNFTRFCVENDLEGMEYLYPIPATVGGAIYMNAGTGKKFNQFISDNLISVKIFDGNNIKELKKEECEFSYRKSIFHKHKDWIILSAKFKLKHQPKKIGEKKIKEWIEQVKKTQNRRYPNAGSIFKKKSNLVIGLLTRLKLKIGAAQIDGNWIINLGNASFKDVIWLIRISKILSYFTFKKPELEIEIWNQ